METIVNPFSGSDSVFYVSEELNSVETIVLYKSHIRDTIAFQKNLIVWKLASASEKFILMTLVSEELNSVETYIIHVIDIGCTMFQKNLIVWKPYVHGNDFKGIRRFQKNLIVWKPYHAIDFSYV